MAVNIQNIPTITPGQQGAQNTVLQNAQSLLAKRQAFSGTNFDPIAEETRYNWENRTAPFILNATHATGNKPGRTGVQAALGGSALDLERTLASLKAQHNQTGQQIDDRYLGQLLGTGFQPAFGVYGSKSPSFLEMLSGGLGQYGTAQGYGALQGLGQQQGGGNQEEDQGGFGQHIAGLGSIAAGGAAGGVPGAAIAALPYILKLLSMYFGKNQQGSNKTGTDYDQTTNFLSGQQNSYSGFPNTFGSGF